MTRLNFARFASLSMMVCIGAAPVPIAPAGLESVRRADLALATIGWRLATTNAALCRDQVPGTGIVLHAVDLYGPETRAVARQVFGFATPVAVEAVVAGSPATEAGVSANDGVETIGGVQLRESAQPDRATTETRDAALTVLERQPVDRPIRLGVLRGGQRFSLKVLPKPACLTRFEVVLGPDMVSDASGTTVRIGIRFIERYPEPELAAVVAHELAHDILRHRARLDVAGVRRGLFAEFGRNGRLVRQTEDDADRLSVSLLYNAGYDPHAAARFWREHGGDVDGGLFRSRTHASSNTRAAAIEAEIATIPPGVSLPYKPAVLATRDRPLQ